MLSRDVFVLEAAGFVAGPFDCALEASVRGHGAALNTGAFAEGGGQFAPEGGDIRAQAAQRLGRDAVVRLNQGCEEMLRIEHWALQLLGQSLGFHYRFLSLLGEAVEVHGAALMRGFGWAIWRRKSSAAVLCLPSSAGGRMTLTLAYRSPAPSPLRRGIPWPVKRNA